MVVAVRVKYQQDTPTHKQYIHYDSVEVHAKSSIPLIKCRISSVGHSLDIYGGGFASIYYGESPYDFSSEKILILKWIV